MGRSVASISQRLEARLSQWERFSKMLGTDERLAFRALVASAKDRRAAIDAVDEADLGVAILLAMMVRLKSEFDGCRGIDGKGGLDGAGRGNGDAAAHKGAGATGAAGATGT